MTIDEAQITGQKDEGYHEWLNGEIDKYDIYDKKIVDVDLKIDIEQHRKALEDAQPDVVKGINELNRNIEGSDFLQEELEEEINPDEKDLWENGEIEENTKNELKEKSEPQKRTSPLKLLFEIIIYTAILIGIIYFTSQNYIKLRNLNSELPVKERKLQLVAGKIVGNQIRNTKNVDSQNARKAIFISKLLSSITPKSIIMEEMTYSVNEDNSFTFSLKGEVSGNQSVATKTFNKYVKDMRDQKTIKRVIVRDQKALPKSGLIFTIDLRS